MVQRLRVKSENVGIDQRQTGSLEVYTVCDIYSCHRESIWALILDIHSNGKVARAQADIEQHSEKDLCPKKI